MTDERRVTPVTEYTVGDKVIPHLHWPDRRSIHLMGHKIDGGQDPVQQLRSWLAAWLDTQKEMVDFGWQCYQDRCENAYVEASVVKRLQSSHAELVAAAEAAQNQLAYLLNLSQLVPAATESTQRAIEILESALAKAKGKT